MITRRIFVRVLPAALAATALQAFAQAPGRRYRIGVLRPTPPPKSKNRTVGEVLLPAALAKLGYVEGRNLAIDWRYAEGNVQRLAGFAREFVDKKTDVIVAVSGSSVQAAMQATATIPIVFFGNFDPVAAKFVASLGRPGRNVTGVLIAPEGTLAVKKLQILMEAVPGARRIAVLAPADESILAIQLPEVRQAAAALGIELEIVKLRGTDYAEGFARMAKTRPDALYLLPNTYFMVDRRTVIDLATHHRVPGMWEWREQAEEGGLMAYGSSLVERYDRIAEYVARILKGANPGEMPVDQPTRFPLVINLKTAKAIGHVIPQSLLLRADEVFQ